MWKQAKQKEMTEVFGKCIIFIGRLFVIMKNGLTLFSQSDTFLCFPIPHFTFFSKQHKSHHGADYVARPGLLLH